MTNNAPHYHCPVCNGKFQQAGEAWHYECPSCGLQKSTLLPAIPSEVEENILDENVRLTGLSGARQKSGSIILDSIKRLGFKNGCKLLDVGCGHGIFLSAAMEAGFDAQGVEPDANIVSKLKKETDLSIIHGYFPEALEDHDQYDIIVFNDVMEHIPAVQDAIAAASRHLRPRGILILNCPDQAGIFYQMARLMRVIGFKSPFDRMWQVGLPSPHVWYFRHQHLSKLGDKAGFETVDVKRFMPVGGDGLWERINYVSNQSKSLIFLTFIVVRLFLPALHFLPKDNSIVFMRRG